jgi:hypothetical protein
MRFFAGVLAVLAFSAAASAQAPPDLRTQLAQGQAALQNAGPHDPVADGLLIALSEAEAYPDMAHDAYPVALKLGQWGLAQHRYDVARRAWDTAANLSSGADDHDAARADALTQEAAAIVLSSVRGGQAYLGSDDARDALIALREAMHLAYAGPRTDPAPPATPAERRWGQARAWQNIIYAALADEGRRTPTLGPYRGDTTAQAPASDNPTCAISLDHTSPQYPRDALEEFGMGDVVVLITFKPDGQSLKLEIVGAVGGDAFVASVRSVIGQWSASQNLHFPNGCTPQIATMTVVQFSVAN